MHPFPGPGRAGGAPSFPTPSSTWLMDEGTGETAADSDGSIDCTKAFLVNNKPTWVAAGLDFDGNDNLGCDVNYRIDTTTTAFSICAAYKPDGTTATGQIIANGTTGYGLYNGFTDNVAEAMVRTTTTTNELRFNATNTVSAGTWYHFCAALSAAPTAANSELYFNGSLASENTTNNSLTSSPSYSSNLTIGTLGFDGTIGIVRFWSGTKLDATQAAAVCNADKTIMAGRSVTITCP